MKKLLKVSAATLLAVGASTTAARADQVFLDDLIVDGSACIGFDTLRLKENNVRIKFQDTSASASFPTNDWQITANDSSNGGQNKFSIDDIDGGRTPFTIEAGALAHSLYVDDGGRIGLKTSSPVVELHMRDGDTPTTRLEQDGSSGFTPQTWDVAGNETNFFIRDTTNGSKLPFRIKPSAPSNSIFVDTDGDVGLGTSSPAAKLHVSEGVLRVSKTGNTLTDSAYLELAAETNTQPSADPQTWFVRATTQNGNFAIRNETDETVPFKIEPSANNNNALTIKADGSIEVQGVPVHPDYVFEPNYGLMPLKELEAFVREKRHLPGIPSKGDVEEVGTINLTQMQMKLLQKVEELTLYTLEQRKTIDGLRARLAVLEKGQERHKRTDNAPK